ncbi:asparaginase [soil metagenome]
MTVAVVFTGGTIASRPDATAGGAVPTLRGEEIIARTPGLAQIAHVEPVDWGLMPASHMGFTVLIEIARLLDELLARGEVSGAVVVQGTDSIEETCFAYDLLVRSEKPVIVTGAMRNAAQPDYDGPRNLADAVRCAASPELAGMGTLVVMAGRVIGAERAVKAHASALDAFQPRNGVLVGDVDADGVAVHGPRARVALARVPGAAAEPVPLVTIVTGMDGTLLRLAGSSRSGGRLPGLVVAATGAGNTHPDVLAAATDLMSAGTAVVLTTRCPAGVVAAEYAFPGGGAQWARAGALLSALDGPKCRIGVALGLGAGAGGDELRRIVRA